MYSSTSRVESRSKINLFILFFFVNCFVLLSFRIPRPAFNCKNTFNPLIKWPAGRIRDPAIGVQVWKSRAIAWAFLFALQLNLIAFWRVINPKQWQPKNYAPSTPSIVFSLTHSLTHAFCFTRTAEERNKLQYAKRDKMRPLINGVRRWKERTKRVKRKSITIQIAATL